MTQEQLNNLGKTLWDIADSLRGAMNADDFRDYMLSFLFLRYLSDNYEETAAAELGADYPKLNKDDKRSPLAVWYKDNSNDIHEVSIDYVDTKGKVKSIIVNKDEDGNWISDNQSSYIDNLIDKKTGVLTMPIDMLRVKEDPTEALISIKTMPTSPSEPPIVKATKDSDLTITFAPEPDIKMFESLMRRKMHYVLKPHYLWSNIAEKARTQDIELLKTLNKAFKYIENESFDSNFQGLFSEINLESEKLGKDYHSRNKKLSTIIQQIADGIAEFNTDSDTLGNAYEFLIGKFAAGSGKKAGEFYTPQPMSTILSRIVTLDSQDPKLGKRDKLNKVLDFACGSGSLLLNVRNQMGKDGIGKLYGQESNITTYNLARMNMLLHGVKDTEFDIYHGDTLKNEWDILNERNPAKKIVFDAIVANPPFSLRWKPVDTTSDDFRFKGYGVAPKSAADFAFLLHGFHYLADNGTMAIILPHGVLFRGGAEERIRTKLLKDGHIDTVIGLPANLFYSTGIPVCILVLKKCKKSDDVLFINASHKDNFKPGKRQNELEPGHIDKIIDTYQNRREEARYSRRVSMDEIEEHGFNLNITRYVSIAEAEKQIDLEEVHQQLIEIEQRVQSAKATHNKFLQELGLAVLP